MTNHTPTTTYQVIKFTSPDIVGSVMSSLPLATARRIPAENNSDGSVNLYVPNDLVNTIQSINPVTALANLNVKVLTNYAYNKVEKLRAVSRSYTLPSAITILCDSTQSTENDLTRLSIWGTANPSATQSWIDNNNTISSIAGADAVALNTAVIAYVASIWVSLATVLKRIQTHSITTTSQIDEFVWPN